MSGRAQRWWAAFERNAVFVLAGDDELMVVPLADAFGAVGPVAIGPLPCESWSPTPVSTSTSPR